MLCSESKTSVPILPISHHRPQLSRKVFIPLPDEDPETSVEMVVSTLSRIFLLSMERIDNRFQGGEKRWHQWWVAWNFSTCHCRVECSDRMSERIYATLWVLFLSQGVPLLDENNTFLKCELDSCEHSTKMNTRLMTRCRCLFTFCSSQKTFGNVGKNATRKSAQDAWMGWRPKGVQKESAEPRGWRCSDTTWPAVFASPCFLIAWLGFREQKITCNRDSKKDQHVWTQSCT